MNQMTTENCSILSGDSLGDVHKKVNNSYFSMDVSFLRMPLKLFPWLFLIAFIRPNAGI